jgi:hypothetical protein
MFSQKLQPSFCISFAFIDVTSLLVFWPPGADGQVVFTGRDWL